MAKAKTKQPERRPEKYNGNTQYYKGIPVRLIIYTESHFAALRAKRFMLGGKTSTQNIWIPNAYLDETGTIKPGVNLDWLFQKAYRQNKFRYAGIAINPFTWQNEKGAVTT